jgi:hypothetical protein
MRGKGWRKLIETEAAACGSPGSLPATPGLAILACPCSARSTRPAKPPVACVLPCQRKRTGTEAEAIAFAGLPPCLRAGRQRAGEKGLRHVHGSGRVRMSRSPKAVSGSVSVSQSQSGSGSQSTKRERDLDTDPDTDADADRRSLAATANSGRNTLRSRKGWVSDQPRRNADRNLARRPEIAITITSRSRSKTPRFMFAEQ